MIFRLLLASLLVWVFAFPSMAGKRPDFGNLKVEDFGELENVRGVTISPDGKKLAMLIGSREHERSVVVQEIGKKAVRIPTGEQDALGVRFLSNSRIMVFFDKFRAMHRGGGRNETRIVFMDLDGRNQLQMPSNTFRRIPGDDQNLHSVRIVDRSKLNRSGKVREEYRFEAVKVNMRTGKIKRVERFPTNYNSPIFDPSNRVRLMQLVKLEDKESDYKHWTWMVRDQNSSEWRQLFSATNLDDPPFSFVGFIDDNTVALSGRMLGLPEFERDKTAIFKMDLADGKISLLRSNKDVDMGGVLVDPYSRYVVGVSWLEGRRNVEYFDPELEALQAQLEGAFPGKVVSIQTWSEDRSKMVVSTSLAGHSTVYYLLDRNTNKVTLIARAYPKIPEQAISDVKYIKYKASDGTIIPAYLTIPVGREGEKNLPMIMLPHGGPRARDSWSNELWRQSFAFMGYVVLQPQFRGSDGYGIAFRDAGNGQWGKKMQSDLSDGVRYLVSKGLVDPQRVCIAGWSYGGYAAMAGGTLTPELYRCVIAGAGVSDLPRVLRRSGSGRGFRRAAITEWWEESIGDPTTNLQELKDTSPVNKVANARAPFLLIHGEEDTTVLIKQTEIFADALRRAKKPYKFIRLKNEDHNLKKGETRVQQLTEMKKFLQEHNPAY